MIINVSEAKAKLSKLLDMVYHGEEVTIAKNNLPIADLVRHHSKGKRKLGMAKGMLTIPGNFNDEDREINRMFYGD
ncbi:MAG: type II toxin-antitoxin system prevent-host-death family antitoxin [Chitinispirillaceae bacterium]|nr:type II toxin-antitoxin system prevent-host-death family antitoxin [Chitinispirillaceae bacterium]